MKTLKLKLGKDQYPIVIGAGALKTINKNLPKNTSSIVVLSDKRLLKHRKSVLRELKLSKLPVHEIALTAGESLKDIESIYPLYEQLMQLKADRNTVLVALGGGSIGDAVGFIAATYMRGLAWIGIPTTLLAQVDSSVGGKTGINHKAGKNLIGAFHQPSLVICDAHFLQGLGQKEIVSGLGEIIKYALTFDKSFFKFLEKNLSGLLKVKADPLSNAIARSLEYKCKAVEKDVFDRLGIREVLNFGHTFGHALEAATKYKLFQHGEAVILGMRFALALSEVRGKLKASDRLRMDNLLCQIPVTPVPKNLGQKEIFPFMKKDKKSEGGKIRFVLLNKIGNSVSDNQVTPDDLEAAYKLAFKSNKTRGSK